MNRQFEIETKLHVLCSVAPTIEAALVAIAATPRQVIVLNDVALTSITLGLPPLTITRTDDPEIRTGSRVWSIVIQSVVQAISPSEAIVKSESSDSWRTVAVHREFLERELPPIA